MSKLPYPAGLMLVTRIVIGAFAIGIMVGGTGGASAQTYPNKPIRIVTGPAGSGGDVTSRLIVQGISAALGQPVIVDNRALPIPYEVTVNALPDGYTLLVAGGSFWTGPLLQKASYDPVKDFSPITATEMSVNVVVVHPALPVKSVKELIDLAKTKPGELNYAGGTTGGSTHLASALFTYMSGVNIVRIPFKSTGAGVVALLGGEVQLMVASATGVAPHIKSGKLQALAVTSAGRSVLFPDLPTVAAVVPGYESVGITGVFARAQTPETIIKRLNQDLVRILNTVELKEKFLAIGAETVGNSPQEFAAVIKTEIARMGKLIKDTGIRSD